MENKFADLISSPLFRVSSVTRFSTIYQSRPESLGDHIVDVSFMAYIIGRNLVTLGEPVDMGLLLTKTLIHDYDEPLIGDIPRLTKYSTEACHTELTRVANLVAKQVSREIDGTDYSYHVWVDDKDTSEIEGLIMKIVDMLSVAKKAVMEVDMLGNMYFLKIIEEVKTYVGDLENVDMSSVQTKEGKQYLKTLLEDTRKLLSEISVNYDNKKTKYTMYDSITDRIVSNGVSAKIK